MKKLTIDFEVKGCDLVLNVYEKDKLDEEEVRKIFENGGDYINALGGIDQHKDYEFTYADMECGKLNIELDGVVVEPPKDGKVICKLVLQQYHRLGLWAANLLGKEGEEADAYASEIIKSDFEDPNDAYEGDYDRWYNNRRVVLKVASDLENTGTTESEVLEQMDSLLKAVTEEQPDQYEIRDTDYTLYDDDKCFKSETFSFKNHDRWKMLSAIKNPEQDVALIMERYKGLYKHSYSWNIDPDKFDFEKLSFHYGRSLSGWDAITAQGNEYYPESVSDGADDEAALLTVTYDDDMPDEWSIEPPWGDIHPSMMILDCSLIEKLLATEEIGSE